MLCESVLISSLFSNAFLCSTLNNLVLFKMAPPIRFCPAAENIAIAKNSVAELLGNKFKVLTYAIQFNVSLFFVKLNYINLF